MVPACIASSLDSFAFPEQRTTKWTPDKSDCFLYVEGFDIRIPFQSSQAMREVIIQGSTFPVVSPGISSGRRTFQKGAWFQLEYALSSPKSGFCAQPSEIK